MLYSYVLMGLGGGNDMYLDTSCLKSKRIRLK